MSDMDKVTKWIDESFSQKLISEKEKDGLHKLHEVIESAKPKGALYADIVYEVSAGMYAVYLLNVELTQVEYYVFSDKTVWEFVSANFADMKMLDLEIREKSEKGIYIDGFDEPLLTEEFSYAISGANGNIFHKTFEVNESGFISWEDSFEVITWLEERNIQGYSFDNVKDNKVEVFIRDLGFGRYSRF